MFPKREAAGSSPAVGATRVTMSSTVSRNEEVIIVNSLARTMGVPVATAASFRRLYLRELVADQVIMVPLSSVPQMQRVRRSEELLRVIPFTDSDDAVFVREKLIELVGRAIRTSLGAAQRARLTDRGRQIAASFIEAERRAKRARGIDLDAEVKASG